MFLRPKQKMDNVDAAEVPREPWTANTDARVWNREQFAGGVYCGAANGGGVTGYLTSSATISTCPVGRNP